MKIRLFYFARCILSLNLDLEVNFLSIKKSSGYRTFMSLKYLKAALIKPISDYELESGAAVAVVMGVYFSQIE